MFRKTGLIALNISSSLADFCQLVGRIAMASERFITYPKKTLNYIAQEVYQSGASSVLIICIVAFLFGTVIVAIAGAQFRTLGAPILVANLIGIALSRELATLLTSICLLFLATARFTDDIASRKHLTKNVYTLCLVRVIVLFFITPILSLCAFYSALLGGAIIAGQQFNINWYQYWYQIFTVVTLGDICFGLFKAMIFGIELALIGCFYGIICRDNRKPLGKGIIASISMGIFLIAFTDSIIELLIYYLS